MRTKERVSRHRPVWRVMALAAFALVCVTLGACSSAGSQGIDTGTGAASETAEEDPWVESFIQSGYYWNGTYEGITNETEITYDIRDGKIFDNLRVMHSYDTPHSHGFGAALYWHFWEPDEFYGLTRGEEGFIESDGSKTVQSQHTYAYEYDSEGRVIKWTKNTVDSDGNTYAYAEEGEYDAEGQYHTTLMVSNGETTYSAEERDASSGSENEQRNSYGDKLFYETDDDGNRHLSEIVISDANGAVIYRIYQIPSDFDTELRDLSDCCIHGYSYDERGNLVEGVVWKADGHVNVTHDVYTEDGHLVYSTSNIDTPTEKEATVTTYQYLNRKTGEKTSLIDPRDVAIQTTPNLVQPLESYLSQR